MRTVRHLFVTLIASCYLAVFSGACASLDSPAPEPRGTSSEDLTVTPTAVVQLFDWPFRAIEAELPTLARIGYSHVHVSPPTLSNPTTQWWGRYQPVDYRVIDGPLGNETEFRSMVTAAQKNGVGIVIDVVFNHMANFGAGFDLTYPPPADRRQQLYGQRYPELDAQGPLFTANDFHFPFCIANYGNPPEVRDGRICGGNGDTGLPDLKQLNDDRAAVNSRVLDRQKQFLQRMVALGVTGFRFDAIKHMEASYFSSLLQGLPPNLLVFGEDIVGPNRNEWNGFLEPFFQQRLPLKFYDFPLVTTMHDAFRLGGDLRSLQGEIQNDLKAISGPLAVTFVLNHDIPQNPMANFYMGPCANTDRYGDPRNEKLAYGFVLGREPGLPYVYSDRGVAGNDGVATDAYKNAHRRCDLTRMVRFHTLTAGLPQAFVFGDANQLVIRRGSKALVAINKAGATWTSGSFDGVDNGVYTDVLTGTTVTASGGRLPNLSVAPRAVAMYVHSSLYTPAVAAQLAALPCEAPPPPACN